MIDEMKLTSVQSLTLSRLRRTSMWVGDLSRESDLTTLRYTLHGELFSMEFSTSALSELLSMGLIECSTQTRLADNPNSPWRPPIEVIQHYWKVVAS